METVTVQLLNKQALKLLMQLQELNLIKVTENNGASTQKLSDQFRGKLSNEVAEALQKHVSESRNEWDRI